MPDQPGPFHDQILADVTRVGTKVDGINLRLDKMNGSIKTLFERIEENQRSLLLHQIDCPALGELAAANARFSSRRELLNWAKPFIVGFLMALLALIAMHFQEIWGRKP